VNDAHQCRRSTALDVLHHAVEDADAPADGEQQHRQQRPDCPDAPCPPAPRLSGLGPCLFAGVSALHIVQCYRDESGRRARLRAAGRPGFSRDHGEASKEQDDGDSVQRLVEGERVVDGRCGAQVCRC
jgi:hypothetical protein